MAEAWVVKDEWTPTLELIGEKMGDRERKERLGAVGFQMVARAKRMMTRSRGFGDEKRYARLKGKWRYHSRKRLAGGSKVNKTPIDASTRPLIDTGDLRRSWDVLELKAGSVDVGNQTPAEKNKAAWNDDRGDWEWRNRSIDEAERAYLKKLDEDLFD